MASQDPPPQTMNSGDFTGSPAFLTMQDNPLAFSLNSSPKAVTDNHSMTNPLYTPESATGSHQGHSSMTSSAEGSFLRVVSTASPSPSLLAGGQTVEVSSLEPKGPLHPPRGTPQSAEVSFRKNALFDDSSPPQAEGSQFDFVIPGAGPKALSFPDASPRMMPPGVSSAPTASEPSAAAAAAAALLGLSDMSAVPTSASSPPFGSNPTPPLLAVAGVVPWEPPLDTSASMAPGDSDLVKRLKDQLALARREAMHKGSEAQLLSSQVSALASIWYSRQIFILIVHFVFYIF